MRLLMSAALVIIAAIAPQQALSQGQAAATKKSATEISIADFFRLPAYRDARISPDGKRLAAVVPLKSRGNLVVIDLESRKGTVITSFDKFDVYAPSWVSDDRLFFSTSDGQEATGRFNFRGQYMIDVDGGNLRELISADPARRTANLRIAEVLRRPKAGSSTGIASMAGRSRNFLDVYEIDFRTLRTRLLSFDTPGRTVGWWIDSEDRPRVALRAEPRDPKRPDHYTYWVRSTPDAAWERVFEEYEPDSDRYSVLGLDTDDRTLYVATDKGRDKTAVFKYDIATKSFGELVVEDPNVDIDSWAEARLLRAWTEGSDVDRGKVVGLHYQSFKPVTVFFDPAYAALQKSVDGALPNRDNFIRGSRGKTALVVSESDTEPQAFYLLTRNPDRLEFVAQSREWLPSRLMAERRAIRYTARDGMPMIAYLTVPRGAEAKNLPLIVNIHGGPWVRAYSWTDWGRWPEAQFFASRGYAVLEPEPRGSRGFGRKHYTSSVKQFGRAMQDDITDGVLALAKDGVIDRSRVCLHGGSYGGYAALQGLVREPELFRCANAFVAVTDLELWITLGYTDFNEFDARAATDYLTLMLGDPRGDSELFRANSPARNAEKIKVPVMLTMGSDDRRVPLRHGEIMRDAMRARGVPVEWHVYAEEGHGFNRDENVIDFYTRSLRFFDTHLGVKR